MVHIHGTTCRGINRPPEMHTTKQTVRWSVVCAHHQMVLLCIYHGMYYYTPIYSIPCIYTMYMVYMGIYGIWVYMHTTGYV